MRTSGFWIALLLCSACAGANDTQNASPHGTDEGGSSATTSTPEAGAGTQSSGTTPLLLTLTLHLENSTFNAAYFDALDSFAQTFEAHGGKLTFEPRDEVVSAAAKLGFDWTQLEARGHAVGSHAGIGGTSTVTLQDFTDQARNRYDDLAPHVDQLTHISGNCGNVDWVTGVVNAGFTATTAATVLCLYSIPAAERPDGYQSLACSGATDPACHQSYPSELSQRIHPWRALDGATWLNDDPNGKLVIFPGSGTLPCLDEEATNPGKTLPSCTLTSEDVTRALDDLDGAIALADPDRLNTYYWVWGSWKLSEAEQPVLDDFLNALDERAARGQIRWANVPEMEDAYAEWEKTHR